MIRRIYILLCCALVVFAVTAQRRLISNIYAAPGTLPLVTEHDIEPETIDTTEYIRIDAEIHEISLDENEGNDSIYGTIPYQSSRLSNGKVQITIPIESFATKYELSHGISLVFDNSTAIGPMGYGWHVSGLPAIRRTSKNYFTDGNTQGVLISGDEYTIDGIRLLLKESADSASVYRSQIGNIKAKKNSNQFIVYYPDGSRAYFAEHDSLCYYITRLVGLDGREVRYSYTQVAGHKLISRITYGEGRSLAFEYGTASSTTEYVAGVTVNHNKKLRRIKVMQGENLLTEYILNYASNSLIGEQLREVNRKDANGSWLKPLKIDYHAAGSDTFSSSSAKKLTTRYDTDDLSKLIVARGRFDHCSEDDGVLMFPNRTPYSRQNMLSFIVYTNQYSPTDTILATTNMNYDQTHIFSCKIPAGNGLVDVLPMDADGIHGDEVVRVNNIVENDSDVVLFHIYNTKLLEPQMQNTVRLSMPAIGSGSVASVRPKSFLPGDFDGDGRFEVLVVSHSGYHFYEPGRIDLIDLSANSSNAHRGTFAIERCYLQCPVWSNSGPTNEERWANFNASDRIFSIDIDGSGKRVLGIVSPSGLKLYSFSFNENGQVEMDTIPSNFPLSLPDLTDKDLVPGHFNGDANEDLIVLPRKHTPASQCVVYLGKGNGDFVQSHSFSTGIENYIDYALTDVDNDGVTDVFWHAPYAGGLKDVYRMGERCTTRLYVTGSSLIMGGNSYSTSRLASLMGITADGTVTYYRYNNPLDVRRSVARIDDGSGLDRLFSHKRLFYYDAQAMSANNIFPYNTFAGGMLVCAGQRVVSNGNVVNNISYGYNNPTLHRQGLGFCGFEKITTADSTSGDKVVEHYSPQLLGAMQSCYSYNSGTHLRTVESQYIKDVGADRHISVLETGRINDDVSTGMADTTSFTHDDYGNVLTAATVYAGGLSRTVTRQYHNVDNNSYYLIGLEKKHETTTSNGAQYNSEGTITTFNDKWLPSSIVTYRNSPANIVSTQTVTYDDSLRVTKVKTKQYSGNTLKRYNTYGDGRLPLSVNDEMTMLSTYTWGAFGPTVKNVTPGGEIDDDLTPIGGGIALGNDEINGGATFDPGLPAHFDDPDMYATLTTRYHYDAAGRTDSITMPDSSTVKINRYWDSSVPGAASMVETIASGKPTVKEWLDPLGRLVRKSTQMPDCRWAGTDYEYDSRNRLHRESMPYFAGDTKKWTVYSYDSYDRLTDKQYPDNHHDTYSYNGLSLTSTIDGVTSTRTLDALGRLMAVTDPGGTIEYDLRPDGQPQAVIVNNDITTTFEYDAFGRRTAINDPSAGRRQTSYNTSGKVYVETDARGKSITHEYNAKGLPTKHIYGGGRFATFTYDAWNNLEKIYCNNGHTKTYSYDKLRRLSTETVDGYKKRFIYTGNQISSILHYPLTGDTIVENYGYSNGRATSLGLGSGESIWQLTSVNARGLPTSFSQGHLSTGLCYNLRGNVTSRIVNYYDNPPVQCQLYSYSSATGNMLWQEDDVHGYRYDYEYDSQNRLTGDGVCYGYDAKGNMTRNDAAGMMTYGSNAPYAMSFLTPASGSAVPQRDQSISFNSMQLPDTIAEGSCTAAFEYYGDMTRAMMAVANTAGHSETRHYYGNDYVVMHQMRGDVEFSKHVLWLGGTSYDAPAALVKDYNSNRWQLLHIVRDNLGSITQLVDTLGNVVQEVGYSSWGLLRDPEMDTLYRYDNQPELLLGYGYTGHEHLPWFGLINMNARLYDPATGRFLNPDPVVQLPDNTQSYNRYSYCLNNPLRYTDPTGLFRALPKEFWQTSYKEDEYEGELLDDVIVVSNGGSSYSSYWISESNNWAVMDYRYNLNRPAQQQHSLQYQIGMPLGCGTIYGDYNSEGTIPNSSISGVMSGSLTGIGYYLKNSNATYLIKNNDGYVELKVYKSGWLGNKYGWTKPVKSIGKTLGKFGTVFTLVDIGFSFMEITETDDREVIIDNSINIAMDLLGFVPHPVCRGFAIAWSLGLHQLYNQWRENVIVPQINDGTVGLPANQPFK